MSYHRSTRTGTSVDWMPRESLVDDLHPPNRRRSTGTLNHYNRPGDAMIRQKQEAVGWVFYSKDNILKLLRALEIQGERMDQSKLFPHMSKFYLAKGQGLQLHPADQRDAILARVRDLNKLTIASAARELASDRMLGARYKAYVLQRVGSSIRPVGGCM
jgi:hypothetical protein